jgi:hypothetical protein
VQSAHELHWIMLPGVCVCGGGGVWLMVLTCCVCRFTQASLKPGQWGEMVGSFSQSRDLLGLGSAQQGIARLSMY